MAGITTAVMYVSEVELGEDTAILRSEYFDTERTVYMDGRQHPPLDQRTLNGHSIGWWEGDVLVVDTTNFTDHRSPYQNGLPSGSQKHVIERYRLNEDGNGATVEVFLEDPEYLSEPFEGSVAWEYTPDAEMFRYNCRPEVSRQFAFD